MDKRIKVFIIFSVVGLMLLSFSTALFGGGGDSEGGEEEHHFNWWGFLGKLFNAIVLFGGLIFLLRKPLIDLLARKSLDVKNDIIQREELLKTTTGQLENIKKRLEKIEEEVENMKNSAEKSGEDEKKRIGELGEREALRIKTLTEEEINNKVDSSIRALKEKIADLTIDYFKKDIESHLDQKAHEKIIEKNIEISGEIIERE
jgi:F0F1-type ATP synthase membrane subunit b/b'